MLQPLLEGSRQSVSIWPVVTIIVGVFLPFTSRGRRTLHIRFSGGDSYEWKPPFFAADMTKDHIAYLQEQVIKGFRRLRIYVNEVQ